MNVHGNGLHNKVNELLKMAEKDSNYKKIFLWNEKTTLVLFAQTNRKALDCLIELGFIPKVYYRYNDADFLEAMDKKFRDECGSDTKRYYALMKCYLKHQIKHNETMSLAYRIARYMAEEWEIDDVEYFGKDIVEKPWIVKYNKSLKFERSNCSFNEECNIPMCNKECKIYNRMIGEEKC